MSFFDWYFAFGGGVYTAAAICRKHTFKTAEFKDIVAGWILGCLFWPVGLWFLYDEV